jgi:peptide/nickel transport system permease protein
VASSTVTLADEPKTAEVRVSRLGGVLRSIVTRFLQLIILLLALSTLLFFLLRLSGDPAAMLAPEDASPELLDLIRQRYALDQPLLVQYLIFLGQLVQGDFGLSFYSSQSAASLVLSRIPATLTLAALAVVITSLIAIPVGTWLGARSGGTARNAATVVVSVFQGTPGFVVGLVLIQLFAVWFRWLPSIASSNPLSVVLPVLTLAAFMVPQLVRVLSSSTQEVRGNDFVRTAVASGASSQEVLGRHVLPNALLGTAALIGSQFAALLSGALITEFIFAWPGLGLLLIDSVNRLDFPVVQAAVFFIALMVFIVNIGVDLLFQIIDPRLRKKTLAA